jgi:hypothetical protein
LIGFTGETTIGFLSNILNISTAEAFPAAKFYMQGPAYPNENPPVRIAKKITKTSPTV